MTNTDRTEGTTTARGSIVVGIGAPGSGRRELDWAAREADARGGRLHLTRAYHLVNGSLPGEPTSDRILRMQMRREAERVLQVARDHVRATWPDLQITTAATDGVVAQALVRESADADLTVVGSRNLGALGSALRDGVSSTVAAQAHGSVVVVEGAQPDPAADSSVVVGVDGSHTMTDVLSFAFQYADLHARPLHAILCGSPDPRATAGWMLPTAHHDLDRWLAETLAGWQEKFPSVVVRREVVLERPADALVAAGAGQDLIVVGNRSRHPRVASVLGSVTQGVLHHATCPVAVVHPRESAT